MSNLELMLKLSTDDISSFEYSYIPVAMNIGQLKGAYERIKAIKRKTGISEEAMNVLIHYTTSRDDIKLTEEFMLKIAGAWVVAGVETAEDAMLRAKAETKRFLEYHNFKDISESVVDLMYRSDYKYEF